MVLYILRLFCHISIKNYKKSIKDLDKKWGTQCMCWMLAQSFCVKIHHGYHSSESIRSSVPTHTHLEGIFLYISLVSARLKALSWMRKTHAMCCMCTDKVSVIPFLFFFFLHNYFMSLKYSTKDIVVKYNLIRYRLISTSEKVEWFSQGMGTLTTHFLWEFKLWCQKGEHFILLLQLLLLL